MFTSSRKEVKNLITSLLQFWFKNVEANCSGIDCVQEGVGKLVYSVELLSLKSNRSRYLRSTCTLYRWYLQLIHPFTRMLVCTQEKNSLNGCSSADMLWKSSRQAASSQVRWYDGGKTTSLLQWRRPVVRRCIYVYWTSSVWKYLALNTTLILVKIGKPPAYYSSAFYNRPSTTPAYKMAARSCRVSRSLASPNSFVCELAAARLNATCFLPAKARCEHCRTNVCLSTTDCNFSFQITQKSRAVPLHVMTL